MFDPIFSFRAGLFVKATILTGASEKIVRLWDVATGNIIKVLAGHYESVGFVAFSPDGSVLLTKDALPTVRLWNASTGSLINSLATHTNYLTSLSFSSDGDMALSSANDGSTKLWNVSTGNVVRTFSDALDNVRRQLHQDFFRA